jgi:MoxR-like ATPase
MLPALQARALLEGRDYVSPDDLAAIAPHVFGHRLVVAPGWRRTRAA